MIIIEEIFCTPKTFETLRSNIAMGYDDVIQQVGNFGPYQRRILLVLILPAITCGIHKMGGVFLGAKPDFRCLLPSENPENATYQSPPNITNLTYPWNAETENWPKCKRYNAGYQHDATDGNLTSTISTVKCDFFVYDKTYYTQTVTTEWNLVCDDAWLKTLSESLYMLADIPGALIFGALSDEYGRKTTLLWGSVMQLIVASLVVVSPNISAFIVLRVFVGTTSSLFLVVYVTAVEMVSPKYRNSVGVIINLAYSTGYLLSAGLAYFIRQWRYLQIAFIVPIITLLAFGWSISESPRWLLNKGQVHEAKDVLRKISAGNGIELPSDNLNSLLSHDDESKLADEETSVFDLLKYPNLRRKTIILFVVWFLSSSTYYGLAWNTSNLGGNDYINFVIAAALEIPAYSSVLYTSDRWGRKRVVCSGLMLAGISLLLTFCVPSEMTWLLILLAMIGKLGVSWSWVSLYIFTVEQYPTSSRNVALGCSSAVARMAAALAPYLNFLFEIATYIPLVMLGFAAVTGALLILLLPETLNRELPETIEDGEKWGNELTTLNGTSKN